MNKSYVSIYLFFFHFTFRITVLCNIISVQEEVKIQTLIKFIKNLQFQMLKIMCKCVRRLFKDVNTAVML